MKEEKGSLKADPEATDEGRRRLLQRLGLGAAVATLAYTSPLLLDLSEASASRGSRGSRRSRGSRGRHFHHHHHHHHHHRSRGSRGRRRRVHRPRYRSDQGDVHIWIDMKDFF